MDILNKTETCDKFLLLNGGWFIQAQDCISKIYLWKKNIYLLWEIEPSSHSWCGIEDIFDKSVNYFVGVC